MKITISGGACLSGLPPDAMLSVLQEVITAH